MDEREFDAIVIGAGPSGEVCAGRLADAGLSVAIVEAHLVGGECSYYACMPSKALLRPSALLDEARRVPGTSQAVSGSLDAAAALARRDEVVHGLDDDAQLPWLREHGIELLRGEGRLAGERRVTVGEDSLTARRGVVLASGSAAAMPPIDGLDSVEPWSNREATTAPDVPASMLVLGGGPVGCELAQAWSRLGAEVTLVESAERLLPREEDFAGAEVAEALRERHGVEVLTGAKLESARRDGDGRVAAEVSTDGETRTVEAERLLVAVGRTPNAERLGLERAGVEPGEGGFVEVDERMRVGGREWLYAIGDVNGRAPFTHSGKYQAWIAAENLLDRPVEALSEALGSPRVTFTEPQVAAVGKTLAQAREGGRSARAIDVPTDGTSGASFAGKGTGGTSRLVVDERSETILGATFSGFETAEMLQAATIALVAEVPRGRLRHAVPAYPTRSELWLRLLDAWEEG